MANDKNLLEIFSRYTPTDAGRRLLASASDVRLRASREERMIEIHAAFAATQPKSLLYAVEAGIAEAYALRSVRILPRYPADALTEDYLPEILCETERVGIVARGFFSRYRHAMTADSLTLTIPLGAGGVRLLCDARTPDVIAGIIRSEFGREMTVKIEHDAEGIMAPPPGREERFAAIDRSISAAEEAYHAHKSAVAEPAAEEEKPEKNLTKIATLLSPPPPAQDGDLYTIGYRTFDLSSPNFAYGGEFSLQTPTPIGAIDRPIRNVVVFGEVFGYTAEETRGGGKFNISFGLTDGASSIMVRRFGAEDEDAKAIAGVAKNGTVLAIRGYTKPDRNDDDLSLYPNDMAIIAKRGRTDNAPEKRVELHLHTNMSSMDAVIPPDVIVKTAKAWGHKAVAITDHGNVQAYPEAMLAAEKVGGIKVIYGIEAYFVDDTARALWGNADRGFDEEMIVFDLETTGLSPINCKITEIGAVLVKDGEVLDRFNALVNPGVAIPPNIVELTGITDEMVADCPPIEEVLPQFLAFIGDRLLIAHNANFDVSFVRAAAETCGLPFSNDYLDTVALSRHLNPGLKRHKLDVLAEYYGLGDFDHHRACDDAEMLSRIFFCMTEKMKTEGVQSFSDMITDMSEHADPLKLKSFHQILLVRNKAGLKNLYKLISAGYLQYYRRQPRLPKSLLVEHREGLLVGSACEAGELFTAILENRPQSQIEEIAEFYDYLEIQPICNNRFLIANGTIADDEGLRELNRRIVALGEKLGKPVVATCDTHFLNPEDEIFRKILLAGMKFSDADKDVGLYFRTTEEMLAEFAYLGEEKAYEIVVTNPNKIADMIEEVRPIPPGNFTPKMEGAEEELQESCWNRARSMYGDELPTLVSDRLERELTSIIKHGFAVLYMIAVKLVAYSESLGYMVGSRGSVGSSFVATMSGISEVNPLPPHYYCPKCRYNTFTDAEQAEKEGREPSEYVQLTRQVGSGYDLPDRDCPVCGTHLINEGHDIPFETFLGFYGDKSPDIDLNFSGDVQGKVHKYTEQLFGSENVFRAGTLGTLASKTAYGFVAKYLEGKGLWMNKAEMNRLVENCVGVKRTTGQHPGGIIVVPREYDVYDFTPIQHPADDPNSDIVTTHFAFSYLHDTILKLDELGHDMPTKLKILERYTGVPVTDVQLNDPAVYELFLSTKSLGVSPDDILGCQIGTWGLPEFGTRFVQQMVIDSRPQNFSDLLQISGLSHGTDVWLGNAQDLIKDGTCTISNVIGTRDSIMLALINYGVEKSLSFKIMEAVRKGKGLTPEFETAMRAANVPEWYLDSCKKIKYMFPKAHAAAYVRQAIQFAWYKVHYPMHFYAAYFTAAPDGFDAEIVAGGKGAVKAAIAEIEKKGMDATAKEQGMISALQLITEAMARGVRFLPVSLTKSDAKAFLPEGDAVRMPFSALNGVGENAAAAIIAAREKDTIYSIEELQIRAKLTKSVMEILRRNGVLDGLSETNQLTLF